VTGQGARSGAQARQAAGPVLAGSSNGRRWSWPQHRDGRGSSSRWTWGAARLRCTDGHDLASTALVAFHHVKVEQASIGANAEALVVIVPSGARLVGLS
jgi:hypothetical protein